MSKQDQKNDKTVLFSAKATQSYKITLALLAGFFSLIFFKIFTELFSGGYRGYSSDFYLIIGFATAVGTYLGSGQKCQLSESDFVWKVGLYTFRFPYSESSFRVEEKTGLASLFISLKPHCYRLHAKKPNGKKNAKISSILKMEDFIKIIRSIEEKTGIEMEKPDSLKELMKKA